jgi:hypothetical protein
MYRYTCSRCHQPHESSDEGRASDHQVWHHRVAHEEDVPPKERVYFQRAPRRPRLSCLVAFFAVLLLLQFVEWLKGLVGS